MFAAAPAHSQRKTAPRVRVSVVGDSVAVNLGEGLRRFGRSRHDFSVQVSAQRGCGLVRSDGAEPGQQRGCDHWKQRWAGHLAKFDPELVVVASAGWDVRDRRLEPGGALLPFADPRVQAFVRSEYEAAAELLSSRGARVVFLTSPCLESSTGDKSGVFDVSRTQRLNDAILRPLAEAQPKRISLLDLYARVCREGRMLDEIEGMQQVRPDGVHFSAEASVWLAEWLTPELEALALRDREIEAVSPPLVPSPPSPPSARRSWRRSKVR